jgi:hypothetical protein
MAFFLFYLVHATSVLSSYVMHFTISKDPYVLFQRWVRDC